MGVLALQFWEFVAKFPLLNPVELKDTSATLGKVDVENTLSIVLVPQIIGPRLFSRRVENELCGSLK